MQEGAKGQLLMPSGIHGLRGFWLYLTSCGIDDSENDLSSHICITYRISIHYQVSPRVRWLPRSHASPLEIALRGFKTFAGFHRVLLASQMDLRAFVETECTMPWCVYSKQTPEGLFSVDIKAYRMLHPLLDRSTPLICQVCDQYKYEK